MISVIVPTYNEKENIKKLILAIHKILLDRYEVVIVDDNSPDGTAKCAEALSKNYPVRVLKRNGKLGLASAVIYGFSHAKGDILGVIDADLQHPPAQIKEFLTALSDSDIAVGSRYIDGGKIMGWGWFRSMVSKGAIILSSPLTDVKDPVSGYFFFKRNVIEDVSFNPSGFKILLEILVKGKYNNVKEVPFTFKVREEGESKLGIGEYVNYLRLLYHLYGFKLKEALSNGR